MLGEKLLVSYYVKLSIEHLSKPHGSLIHENEKAIKDETVPATERVLSRWNHCLFVIKSQK